MLERIFPRQFDNAYRGRLLAIWLFVPIILFKAVQGANSIIITRQVMTGADGIPLDLYGAAGADAAIALFALLGLYVLVLPVLGLVALIRYRAMIPLLYLMLLLTYAGGKALSLLHPLARSDGQPIGFYINLALLALMLIGFVLSLLNRPGKT